MEVAASEAAELSDTAPLAAAIRHPAASEAPREALSKRQKWVLAELARVGQLRRQDVEKHFGVCARTAKRDLGTLTDAVLIAFDRSMSP